MPEYLSPRVYVEEIDTGPKPIEGVSTSTAGMIGVTERGPVNVPILVTSAGEFQRWFGQWLNIADFGEHCYLPHAIDGFFGNNGKRVYVTRILETAAAQLASRDLFLEAPSAATPPRLLAPAAAGATSAVISGPLTIAANDWVRIGSGSDAEYRMPPAGATAADTTFVPVRLALQLSHGTTTTSVEHYTNAALGGPVAVAISGDVQAGATSIILTGAGPVHVGDLLQINSSATATNEELVYVADVGHAGAGPWVVTLRTQLQIGHADAETVNVYAAPTGAAGADQQTLNNSVQAGAELPLLAATVPFPQPNLAFAANDVVVFADTLDTARSEARRIGTLARVALGVGAYLDYGAGWRYENVSRTDSALAVMTLDAPLAAGAVSLAVDNRHGLSIGDTLRIGNPTDANVEYVVIRDLPNALTTTPDPGRIILETALENAHGGASTASRHIVAQQTLSTTGLETHTGTLVLSVDAGGAWALLSRGWAGAPTPNDLLRVTSPDGDQFLHRISVNTIPFVPQTLTFPAPLSAPHDAGSVVIIRHPVMRVEALDYGAWGNRLRIAAAPDASPRVRTRIRVLGGIIDPTHIRLDSPAGIEPGTVLSLADAQGDPLDIPFKVTSIDRQNDYLITLAAALPPAAVAGSTIVSLEFRLDVYLLRQPDPALPIRNAQILDTESFRNLSLDPRHSRYVHKIIGTTWTPSLAFVDDDGRALRKVDNRSEGGSQYIRIRDLAQDIANSTTRTATLQSVRLGPEFLLDVLPDGRQRPARLALSGGDDQVAAISDHTYVGDPAIEPRERTGLQSLTNINDISILAAPGVTSVSVQTALVTQCEQLRYRFAVLDGASPPDDSLVDVQNQRQQFDTKYAALYHPWLVIPDPYPTNPAQPADFPIPPAGHVLGIYARIDVERGVHKAPANEVVRGITGITRALNQEQHDILNPYPVNINVIRDFRNVNRSIRVYGGRCITSDSDWKYVNVRRLLIFIEASIDQGLQWVVFEPNAEPLWARVRRSITNFLTLVWRNGALEGTKPEEAFFVKCDRTTMTQTDIDEGRLICLVGVAPVKPAEFVIVRIGLWTAHADAQ
jgi:phage tail sheath protein FI